MSMRHHLFVLAVVAAGSAACAREASPPRTVAAHHASARRIAEGTQFTATLNQPLSTTESRKGDRFTLTVNEDVHAEDGSVVIASGTRIEGRVARVDRGEENFVGNDEPARLLLSFDGLHGNRVVIIDAQGYASVGVADAGASHDAVLIPPVGPRAAIGGGPREGGDNARSPIHHIVMPAGTKLVMMITR